MDNLNDLDFINSIFLDFFNFCHFNPDSKEHNEGHYNGNLLSYEADAWEISRHIVRLVKQYNSPYIAFVLLKASISHWEKDIRLPLGEIINDKHKLLLEIFKKIFLDERCSEIEQSFVKLISKLASKPNLIGEIEINDLVKRIPAVVKQVEELHLQPLLVSNIPLGEIELRNKIRTYPDMGNCIIDIENSAEGLYLVYINPDDSIDGYFSFIYKSNGNIISINDQIKEAYIGQHRVERRRNASYVEDKAFGIFPYNYMFEFSKPDSKGYYTEYKLKGEFSLNELPLTSIFALTVAMLLVIKKYNGKTFSREKVVYSSHFIGEGTKKLIETKALVLKKESALIQHLNTKIELTRNEILQDCNIRDNGKDNFYSQWKPSVVNYLKDLWTDEEIFAAVPEKADYSYILNNKDNIEMLTTIDVMKKNALFVMRKEMKDKIQRKIEDYFVAHDFGNDGIKTWRKLVEERKDLIFSKIKGEDFVESGDRKGVFIGYLENGKIENKWDARHLYFPFNDIHKSKVDRTTSYNRCYLTDDKGTCRYHWEFMPKSWEEACDFLEINENELPKELRGWTCRRNESYGNSILQMTDEMENLQNGYMCFYDYYFGMCRRESEYLEKKLEEHYGRHTFPDNYAIYNRAYPFNFSIAVSSRTFKKMFPGVELPKNEKE